MEQLEIYLTGEFLEDERQLAEVEDSIGGILDTFRTAPFSDSAAWAYEISSKDTEPPKKLSQSTTAMIVSALEAGGHWLATVVRRPSSGYPMFGDFAPVKPKLDNDLAERINSARDALKRSLRRESEQPAKYRKRVQLSGKQRADEDTVGSLTWSSTFGGDDPLTLGWLLEIFRNEALPGESRTLEERIRQIVQEKAALITGRSPDASSIMNATNATVADSSYILVRFARLLCHLWPAPESEIQHVGDLLFRRFETRLHDHLSFREIPDSRFDPAELAFCLEGMLLFRRESVVDHLFDRVFKVMAETQEAIAFWRAETPMLVESAGKVLFPVSIETVNSLLAACALFDEYRRPHEARASRYIALIKRYWSWLKAQKASTRVGDQNLKGWHSEHVNDPNVIHPWETSQVLEFLIAFRDQLKRHMARQALTLSRLDTERPKMPVEAVTRSGNTWRMITDKFEPARCLGERYRIYTRAAKDFFGEHVKDEPRNWSMLLYGPPRTGKSTFGKNLAAALGLPFITVTVSDFLAGGQSEVENRAKMIFQVLKAQPKSVVLFDEMDQFLLDRDSEYFHDQDTVFQFMTPGMLTKLADLRASKSVIFIIATNYAERIDAAIKGTGRIDQQYLLPPMDGNRRLKVLKSENDDFASTRTVLDHLSNSESLDEVRALGAFLGYRDLENVAKMEISSAADLINALKGAAPPIRPNAYSPRFKTKKGEPVKPEKAPLEELLVLLALDLEAQSGMGDAEQTVGIKHDSVIQDVMEVYRKIQAFEAAIDDIGALHEWKGKIIKVFNSHKPWPDDANTKT